MGTIRICGAYPSGYGLARDRIVRDANPATIGIASHEHGRIRCAAPKNQPAQCPRSEEIRVKLPLRIAYVEQEKWGGETEGLKVSFAAADAKLAQLDVFTVRRASAPHLT
jgi:hypothetical protein